MISYYTDIDIETCKLTIFEQIEMGLYQMGGVRGKVDFDSYRFRLFKMRKDGRCRVFHGELIRKGNGTIINGEFRAPEGAVVMTIIWFICLTLVWLFVFLGFISGSSNNGLGTLLAVTFFIGAIEVYALQSLKFGYIEKEENHILYTMATKLNATPIQNQD